MPTFFNPGGRMFAGGVNHAVLQRHLFRLGQREPKFQEFLDQMTSDVTAQNFVCNIGAAARSQDFRHRSADVCLGIDKGAVNVEDVDRKRRNHDALSRFLRPAAGRLRACRGDAAVVRA